MKNTLHLKKVLVEQPANYLSTTIFFFLPYCIIHDCQLFQNSLLSVTACAFLDYSVHLGELTGRSI